MDNYIIHKTYMGYVAESKDFNNYHLLMAKTLEGQARMSPLQK